jgi:RNA polymerase sigma-70 factor, ECF subfamily
LGVVKRVLGVAERVEPSVKSGLPRVSADVVVRGAEPFDAFYQRERRAMVALAYATSGSRMAAEDIAQDAFSAAFRDWDRVGRLDNPATWVRRVVINQSVSSVRRRVAAAKGLARLAGRTDRIGFPSVDAETEHVWSQVRLLPKRQRQAVALRYVEQLTMAEIGEVLGCSKETVNTHLRRAHEALAHRLAFTEDI